MAYDWGEELNVLKRERRQAFLEAVYEFFEYENKRVLKLVKRNRLADYKEELEHIRYWQMKGYIRVVPDSHKIDEIKVSGTPLGRKFIKENQ